MRLTLYCASLSFVLINVDSKSYKKPQNIPPTKKTPQVVPYYTLKMQAILCDSRMLYVKLLFRTLCFVGLYSVPNLIVMLFNLLYLVFIVGFHCKGCVLKREREYEDSSN